MLNEPAVSSENTRIEKPAEKAPLRPRLESPIPPTRQHAQPSQLIQLGLIIGVALITLGAVIGILREDDLLELWFGNHVPLFDIGLGLVIGSGVGVVLWIVGKYSKGFYAIREKLIATLDFRTLTWWHIIILSLLAAFPEEIFFRGALQPVLGIFIAAVIFGALHGVTLLYFAYATIAGLGLGLLVLWQGDLWMAIAAHFAVDFVGLGFLKWWVTQSPIENNLPHPPEI